MAEVGEYDLVEGDNTTLRVTCRKKADASILDLTNKTVTLKWYASDGTTLVTRAMSIVNPATDGVAEYTFQSQELYAYAMTFEVEVVDGIGNVVSSLNPIKKIVRKQFA